MENIHLDASELLFGEVTGDPTGEPATVWIKNLVVIVCLEWNFKDEQ